MDFLCLVVIWDNFWPTASSLLYPPMKFFLDFLHSPEKRGVECRTLDWGVVFHPRRDLKFGHYLSSSYDVGMTF